MRLVLVKVFVRPVAIQGKQEPQGILPGGAMTDSESAPCFQTQQSLLKLHRWRGTLETATFAPRLPGMYAARWVSNPFAFDAQPRTVIHRQHPGQLMTLQAARSQRLHQVGHFLVLDADEHLLALFAPAKERDVTEVQLGFLNRQPKLGKRLNQFLGASASVYEYHRVSSRLRCPFRDTASCPVRGIPAFRILPPSAQQPHPTGTCPESSP